MLHRPRAVLRAYQVVVGGGQGPRRRKKRAMRSPRALGWRGGGTQNPRTRARALFDDHESARPVYLPAAAVTTIRDALLCIETAAGFANEIQDNQPDGAAEYDYDDVQTLLGNLDSYNVLTVRPALALLQECSSAGPDAPRHTVTLSARDVATVLAALRHWQETTDDIDPATEFADGPLPEWDDPAPHRHADIDGLCERINCGE